MAVSPATGKTAARHCRLLLDEAELSGDARQLAAAGVRVGAIDQSGWSADIKTYLAGQAEILFGDLTAVFSNLAAANPQIQPGSHVKLAPIESFLATLPIGIRAAPAIGNPAMSSTFQQFAYTADVTPNDVVLVKAQFAPDGTASLNTAVWGALLAAGSLMTITTTNGSVDNGAASTGGAVAFLHLTQPDAAIGTNNWSLVIEHSADDSSWSTLITFTANGSTLTAERQAVSGTVNRYTRLKATRTAGNGIIPWVNLIRL